MNNIQPADVVIAYSITGDEDNNKLRGGPGADTIEGLGGNDTIWGKGGDDVLNGGDGDDKIYDQPGNGLLFGGDGNDKILGNTGNDECFGEAGNDLLKGGGGSDILVGGAGSDTLIGGGGSDVIALEYTDVSDVDVIKHFHNNEDQFQLAEGLSYENLGFINMGTSPKATSITYDFGEGNVVEIARVFGIKTSQITQADFTAS